MQIQNLRKKSGIEKEKYPGHGIRGFAFQMNQGNSHFVLTIKRNLEVTGSRKLRVSLLSFALAIDAL